MRILTAFLLVLMMAVPAVASDLEWCDSLDKGKADAAKSGKAIFVFCTWSPGL